MRHVQKQMKGLDRQHQANLVVICILCDDDEILFVSKLIRSTTSNPLADPTKNFDFVMYNELTSPIILNSFTFGSLF